MPHPPGVWPGLWLQVWSPAVRNPVMDDHHLPVETPIKPSARPHRGSVRTPIPAGLLRHQLMVWTLTYLPTQRRSAWLDFLHHCPSLVPSQTTPHVPKELGALSLRSRKAEKESSEVLELGESMNRGETRQKIRPWEIHTKGLGWWR